ncbi:hypothetical protein [Cellulosimicrobium sp. 72-3]|uniref:hypothetical protein n=1 Tax=Cellulosimicrobium sp. 72-3 TaxID=2731680 RepID=UPI00148EB5DB|nr:hypothetical protein [Cellulosimicrobium sp. 72-3]
MAHESDPATYPPVPLHGGLRSSPDSWELWGEIDYAVVESAQPRPSPAHRALHIDASRVTFLDSAGVSLLLLAASAPLRPIILGCSDYARDVLELAGASDLFVWSTTRPSA